MKKAQLFATAAAILLASSAYAQTGNGRPGFEKVNACQGCTIDEIKPRTVSEKNPNGLPQTTIDNCSVVIQEGSSLTKDTGNRAVVDQQGSGNKANLFQRQGTGNYGLQVQDGKSNQALATVWGSKNTTLQFQKGEKNKAGINVDLREGFAPDALNANGDGNWAQQNQAGDDNVADIKIYGNNNIASQDQQGKRNSAGIFQRVNTSMATQSQIGNDNEAQTFQGKPGPLTDSPSPFITGQRSCIEQTGNFNQAVVTQNVR